MLTRIEAGRAVEKFCTSIYARLARCVPKTNSDLCTGQLVSISLMEVKNVPC